MHQRHATMPLRRWQASQPGEPRFSQRLTGRVRHLPDRSEKGFEVWRLLSKLPERLRPEKHFIRIAHHALLAEIANPVHNFHRTGSSISQIAAVQDQVGRGLPKIRQNRLKSGPVAMDVGDDGDTHYGFPMALDALTFPNLARFLPIPRLDSQPCLS